ncbi:hypothetical protein AKJ57_01760 [candidate division MSBL1 archaeon SCGC-AAA259A05]|uniref:Uncharacterized protein n=1 Tax=candidate division MSBL1 archaeon SCGC-AAA259A05 TaxID=1698259 RepID=A0A133UAQ0_9EURY|nr:hypothetical protein AKJ57_01760 [candidate division MSBL1 archaeon SCGC-AAA259A05]
MSPKALSQYREIKRLRNLQEERKEKRRESEGEPEGRFGERIKGETRGVLAPAEQSGGEGDFPHFPVFTFPNRGGVPMLPSLLS